MTRQQSTAAEIDRDHRAAIRAEIGDRLRFALARNSGALPPDLVGLAQRFEGSDSDA
jgi:hypothetical protein